MSALRRLVGWSRRAYDALGALVPKRHRCDGCGARSARMAWGEARALGWYYGTWYPSHDGSHNATVCPDCRANDADPTPY
jgi:hypothetical protein